MKVAIAIGYYPAYVMVCVSKLVGVGGEFNEAGTRLSELWK